MTDRDTGNTGLIKRLHIFIGSTDSRLAQIEALLRSLSNLPMQMTEIARQVNSHHEILHGGEGRGGLVGETIAAGERHRADREAYLAALGGLRTEFMERLERIDERRKADLTVLMQRLEQLDERHKTAMAEVWRGIRWVSAIGTGVIIAILVDMWRRFSQGQM